MKLQMKRDQLLSTNGVSAPDLSLAVIRPAKLSDTALIEAMHRRLSLESMYYRYLRPYTPSPAEIEQVCQLDESNGAAFVIALPGSPERILGLGYYIIQGSPQAPIADPAILIEDEFQGLGLGKLLFQQMGQHARSQGVRAFLMLIHLANQRMMSLIRRSGFPFQEGKMDLGAREMQVLL
jgi:GNAT superfamily N-acetyltransferase